MMIRNLKNTDIAACLSIYNYDLENTAVAFEESPLTFDGFERRVLHIAEQDPFIVTVEDTKVIGYVYSDTFNERTAYRFTADLSLCLNKAYCNKGV